MGSPIILDNKVYEQLKVLKRAIGPKASFNTVVENLVQNSAGSAVQERIYIQVVRGNLQRIEIRHFVNNLMDLDLLGNKVSQEDIMTLLLLVINGQWEKLNTLVSMKAKFIEQALDAYETNLEVIKSHSKSLDAKMNGEWPDPMCVKNAIRTIGMPALSDASTEYTQGTKGKSKSALSKTRKRKNTKA